MCLPNDGAHRKTAFTDGNGHTTGYAYDAANRQTGKPANRQTGISYPDNTGETWAYQNNNRLLSHTDGRGVVGTNAYNAAGQLTGISYSDNTAGVSVAYDADGRKTSQSDGGGTTTYTYDNASRLTSRITPAGSVGFSYDAANRLTVRTLAGAGTTAFAYDASGKMTSTLVPGASGAETTAYAYDNAGRILSTTFANGDVETTTYDANTSDLASDIHTRANGSVITSAVYTYDNGGKKTSETSAGGATVSYGYDNAGQLVSEARTGTTAYAIGYAYDNAGNRTSKTQNGQSEGYSYDAANKLITAGPKSYAYDLAGNVQSVSNAQTGVTTNLAWDAQSRLTGVTGPTAAASASYSYNALDQRIGKMSNGSTFAYTHESDAVDSAVLSDGQAVYQHGLGLISEVRNGASSFYKSDGLGSTRALTNASGATTDEQATDAFGNTISASGSTPTSFGFAGQHGYKTDSETGLMLLGHRYYDPSTGRFLSRDPIRAGYNWYAYCDNDPVNALDTKGLFVWHIGFGGGAMFGNHGGSVEYGIAVEIPIFGGKKWDVIAYKNETTYTDGFGIGSGFGLGTGAGGGTLGGFLGSGRSEGVLFGPLGAIMFEDSVPNYPNQNGDYFNGIELGLPGFSSKGWVVGVVNDSISKTERLMMP